MTKTEMIGTVAELSLKEEAGEKIANKPKAINANGNEKTNNNNSAKPNKKKATLPPQKPDVSLYKYENANSEFYHSLSLGQYLNASNFIAIDIDNDKVRYVIGKAGSKNILAKEWSVQLAPSSEKDRQKGIKIVLDNIKTNVYKSGYKVHVCFFSPDITIRQFILPKLKKVKELKTAIYFKLQTDLPGFSEHSIWRYKIIEEFEDEDTTSLRVVALVVPGDVIRNLINMLDSAGLKPETLIPRPVASFHAFQHMIDKTDGDVLVDISYDITHINLITENNLEYARNISSGAANLEVAVRDKKGKILGPDAMGFDDEDGIGKSGAVRPDKIRKVLRQRLKVLQAQQNPVLQLFKNELQNSVEYFNKLHKNKRAKRIFLTGYGIQKESLLSFLKNNLNLPVFVLSPKFEEYTNNALQFGQYFTTLGTVIGAKDSFNLIPRSYKNSIIFKRLNFLMVIFIIVALFGMGYLNNSANRTLDGLNSQLSNLQAQYEKLNPIETEYQKTNTKILSLQNEQTKLINLIKKESPAIQVMKFLSQETPKQIVLSDFDFILESNQKSGKKSSKPSPAGKNAKPEYILQYSGNIVGDYLLSDITLINYVDHLKNLEVFKTVDIIDKQKKSKQQSMKFIIKAKL